MPRKLTDILAQADANLEYRSMGEPPEKPTQREVVSKPGPRARRLRELYYDALFVGHKRVPVLVFANLPTA